MLLKRLVFFGGKGGVGKSTLSCATALELSKREKTLLVSVDPAHSLSGILEVSVGPTVKRLRENLYAVELDAEALVEEYAQRVISSLGDILPSVYSGIREYARYLKSSPTALETAVLDRLVDYFDEFTFVVVDSAPTGQMLRLFNTAHMVGKWFDFLKKVSEERARVEAFMGRRERFSELIQRRREKIYKLLDVFRERTVVFAVFNEEPLSMQEAQMIKSKLTHVKVYMVANRWKSVECEGIKVPQVERPYGIKALEKLQVKELVDLLLM